MTCAPHRASTSGDSAPPAEPSRVERILMIDDDPLAHKSLEIFLAARLKQGVGRHNASSLFGNSSSPASIPVFKMDSAFDGQTGLELVRRAVEEKHPYPLAFVDMRMPGGWDGGETSRRIWQADPDVQIVICTADPSYTLQEIIGKLGYSDRFVVLKKPFDALEVQQLIYALAEKWRLHQEARLRLDELGETIRLRTEELIKKDLELRQAQKLEAIGNLAAGIAHEINTPIQFAEHNLQFLRESFPKVSQALTWHQSNQSILAEPNLGNLTATMLPHVRPDPLLDEVASLLSEIPSAIEDALQGTRRVAKIVQAMKEFSHPGSGENGAPMPTDINQAIESTVTVARNEWKYVADVVMELDATLPAVPVFVGEFNQVILNLVVNASHAIADVVGKNGSEKGTITVSTCRDGQWAEVRVRDTGTGIPEKLKDRVFEPFFTTKPVGKGTGQGLALARSLIVEKHRGELRFLSESGKGACFIIRLPLSPQVNPGKANQAHADTRKQSR